MAYISDETKEEIISRLTLEDFLTRHTGLHEQGRQMVTECPMCHKELTYARKKNLYKCHHCGFGGSGEHGAGMTKWLMEAEKMDYPTAMQLLARMAGVEIPDKPRAATKHDKTQITAIGTSYKNTQLLASGLTKQDVRAKVLSEDGLTVTTKEAFIAATIDRNDQVTDGDDMVIQYYDLDGRPVTYIRDKETTPRMFYRVRWQIPEAHMLKDGSVPKYKTPRGGGIHIYIPQKIRDLYNGNATVPRIFFTEGEKKAEKCCKHGMSAFGMPGINCLVGKDNEFPEDIIKFIERCGVKEIVFIMDSDWDELSNKLTPDKDVRTRPRNFFYAARRFRDWMQTLTNRKTYVNTYLILGRTPDEKGIDDLLAGSLKNHESEYAAEVEEAINEQVKSNAFPHFFLYKISGMPDGRLSELWHLNNMDDFIDRYRDELIVLDEFLWGNNKWRVEKETGDKVLAQPLSDDETFWDFEEFVSKDGRKTTKSSFNYLKSLHFFQNRGFFRYQMPNNQFKFVRIDHNRVSEVNSYMCRDYAMELAMQICKEDVINMLLRGAKMYFGQDSLSSMEYCHPTLTKPRIDSETLLFKNCYVRCTADGVEVKPIEQITTNYWADQVKDFDFHKVDRMFTVTRDTDGSYTLDKSDTADRCEFATFLYMTGLFGWEQVLDDSRQEIPGMPIPKKMVNLADRHMLSKMTAIGYLLHHYRDESSCRAVIGMDGKMSEVGESNGGSGKSLLGKAIGHMLKQVTLDGKKIDIKGDPFVWERVDETSQNIFIDDVAVNFDFELLYPVITGDMEINGKGVSRYVLSGDKVPKIYLTTNHALNGMNGSSERRQFKLAFSDFYNSDFQPRMQFGHNFFDRYWEEEQWNLFYNFMVNCLEIYLHAAKEHWGIGGGGLIEAPTGDLERRQLRQMMGEFFFEWMNDWLGINEDYRDGDVIHGRLNQRWGRVEAQDKYKMDAPAQERKYYTPNKWWKKLTLYCRFYGFRLNPIQSRGNSEPQHDKCNGLESITVANSKFEETPEY